MRNHSVNPAVLSSVETISHTADREPDKHQATIHNAASMLCNQSVPAIDCRHQLNTATVEQCNSTSYNDACVADAFADALLACAYIFYTKCYWYTAAMHIVLRLTCSDCHDEKAVVLEVPCCDPHYHHCYYLLVTSFQLLAVPCLSLETPGLHTAAVLLLSVAQHSIEAVVAVAVV
jgi:hypothetical protein